jgi:hypothetical protein
VLEPGPGELERRLETLDDDPPNHAPTTFDLDRADDRARLGALLNGERAPVSKRDALFGQVRELVKARRPGRVAPRELDDAARSFLRERGAETYGIWVHYPWRRLLVRVLPRAEFVELRTSRNRYKITLAEQERLGSATLGIVGLSAGHSIAVGLALERVGSRFRLADFDAFELSNMNRVASGVPSLGVNKAILAARQLYEIDPYLDVTPFERGITNDTIDAFFDGGTKLDVLIEECDDLYMKVRLREEAKARGIPVIMETNDRGLLDVERFDGEPERPVFHGLLEGTRSDELLGLDTEGKTPFLLRILGTDMSPRLAASLIEIDKTVTGWPQLASGNMLGGAVVTDVARRVLLGQPAPSGRYSVDLEALVASRNAEFAQPFEGVSGTSVPAARELERERPVAVEAKPSRSEIEWLVRQATLAPSGGNDQPWRFVWRRGNELEVRLDRLRSGSFLDFERSASFLALGAAAENAWIAASGLKRAVRLEPFPAPSDPDLAYRLILGPPSSSVTDHPLLSELEARVTNRQLGERKPLRPEHGEVLRRAAREREAELELVTDPKTLEQVGVLLGELDRFRFLCERLHTAMMSELRLNEEEAAATRDGIDVATLELDAAGMAGLRLLSNPKTSAFLRSLGHGVRLETSARRSIAAASAVGLVSIDGVDSRAHVQAGRAVQNVWLWATRLGLALQPMSIGPYLFARLTRGAGEGFTSDEIGRLSALRERFERVFPATSGRAQPMLFRVARAPAPKVRSLRRSVSAVLTES